MTTLSTRLRARWLRGLLVAAPLLVTLSCGAGFDTPDDVKSLRVLAIQKDHPYATPTQDPNNPSLVQLTMLWHDGFPSTSDEPRPIQRLWFSGSENLPGDQYFSGLATIHFLWQLWSTFHTPEELQDGYSWSPVELPPAVRGAIYADALPRLNPNVPPELADSYFATYRIGVGDRFTYPIPPRIIENHRSTDPEIPAYGLAFVFFTACAGHIEGAPEWENIGATTLRDATLGFPFLCRDGAGTAADPGTGQARDSDSYVAGYTQQFVYGDGSANLNPVIRGVKFNGQELNADSGAFCIDGACVPETPLPESCDADDTSFAQVPVCKDHCPKYEMYPLMNELENNEVDTFTSASGNPVSEQMWIDYYATAGEFDGPARSLRDATLGWFTDYGQEWKAPSDARPAFLWAVVHDNRGGAAWVRLRVCAHL